MINEEVFSLNKRNNINNNIPLIGMNLKNFTSMDLICHDTSTLLN